MNKKDFVQKLAQFFTAMPLVRIEIGTVRMYLRHFVIIGICSTRLYVKKTHEETKAFSSK